MKPVLITGGAGYIGSHTARRLVREGHQVVVLDNLSTGHLEAVDAKHFYRGDIADSNLVEYIIREHNIKSVIHFAAKSLVSESLANPQLYFHENTAKSFAFLEAAARAGVKHFVFSSTAAVYGIPDAIPIREESGPAPINPYGASKRMIEEYLEWLGRSCGINWVGLRYFNAAGASPDGLLGEDHRPETHLIPLIMQAALGQREELSVFGMDYPTPDGTCIRDFIHVIDLANAHILALGALEEGLRSGIFNVGTGKGSSVLEIVEKSRAVTGHKLSVHKRDRREGDPPVLVADSTAIKETLGWEPVYSNMENILSSAWQWHSAHPVGYRQ